MASSARPDVPEAVWAGLTRIRDISRLVLVAVQRDDLDEIDRLAHEADRILAHLAPLLQGRVPVPSDLRSLLDDVVRGHGRMVEALSHRKDEVADGILRLRSTRGRLRGLRLNGPSSGGSGVDRVT